MEKIFKIDPKKLLLIDSLGALLTAFSLSLILGNFESFFGVPKNILYYLSCIALLFVVYSFTCSLLVKRKWGLFLKIISFANLSYCVFTGIFVFFINTNTTIFGYLYFGLEIVILLILVFVELKIAFLEQES